MTTGTPTPTPTRRRLGRAERRASIVDGAARAFAPSGFAATSMAEIADAAGVSHLIVYRHFDSKEALYEAVLDQAVTDLRDAVLAPGAVGRYGPTPAALLAAARRRPEAFQVLWHHAVREPDFVRSSARAERLLTRPTRDALAPMVPASSLTWAARATVTYLVQAVLVWIESGDPRHDARFAAATSAALRAGIRSWATG